jgi:multisubunit Na+/H+ antiporter MnhB subunit
VAVKWALAVFALAVLVLLVVTKAITLLQPRQPGAPPPPLLRRLRRALWWSVALPVLLGLAVLVLALWTA